MTDQLFQLRLSEFDIVKANAGTKLHKVWNASFPKELYVQSHISGRTVKFVPVPENHPQFDQDQWDGEAMVYHTTEPHVNVSVLVLSHG